MNLTLIIMAAGMGSRYGGLKQLEQVGPEGEIIMDYSIHDAVRAGFNKIVFVINRGIEHQFKEVIGAKTEKIVKTEYVFQNNDIRAKPLGTAHAVLCCKDKINEPFAVINADDFYGAKSFEVMGDFLKSSYSCSSSTDNKYHFAMVGFELYNTLTENGSVSRGICIVDNDGFLNDITERTKIMHHDDKIMYTEDQSNWICIPDRSYVSMNFWGFTPSVFEELERYFQLFLVENKEDMSKAEFYLPYAVNHLLNENKADIRVLKTDEKWYGVTYKEDKKTVNDAIAEMIIQGKYKKGLY